MLDVRTLGLAAVVFGGSFGLGWWLGLGKAVPAAPAAGEFKQQQATTSPLGHLVELKPKFVALAPSPASAPPASAATPAPQGKGLTSDDNLRQSVIGRAQAYQRPRCNEDSKTFYISAATRYAEALMRSAGCNNFPKCPMGEGNLTDVWQSNRSAADLPVAQAMAAAHASGGLSEKDFRADVGRAVRVIAGAEFDSGPRPACASPGSRNATTPVRVRR